MAEIFAEDHEYTLQEPSHFLRGTEELLEEAQWIHRRELLVTLANYLALILALKEGREDLALVAGIFSVLASVVTTLKARKIAAYQQELNSETPATTAQRLNEPSSNIRSPEELLRR